MQPEISIPTTTKVIFRYYSVLYTKQRCGKQSRTIEFCIIFFYSIGFRKKYLFLLFLFENDWSVRCAGVGYSQEPTNHASTPWRLRLHHTIWRPAPFSIEFSLFFYESHTSYTVGRWPPETRAMQII